MLLFFLIKKVTKNQSKTPHERDSARFANAQVAELAVESAVLSLFLSLHKQRKEIEREDRSKQNLLTFRFGCMSLSLS